MADIDGSWKCTVKSPLGDQNLTLLIRSEGSRFTGEAGGAMGSMPIEGEITGDTLSWKLSVTTPMTMTLDCEATIDGDALTGSVGAGAFGSFPLTGTRGS
jgi:hypothetical protein